MKNINLIYFILLTGSFVFSGCKKKDDDPLPDSGSTCKNVIGQEVIIYDPASGTTDTTTKIYKYNADKKLVKIEYKFNSAPLFTRFDTLFYSASGVLDSVKTYNTSDLITPVKYLKYTYASGMISTIKQKGTNNNGAFVKTKTYTYNGSGLLTNQSVSYTSGTPDGSPETFTSIVYTGSNITSANITEFSGQNATLTYSTTAVNPYAGLYLDPDDPTIMFSANNVTSVYSTLLGPGTGMILTKAYTYVDGKVSTIVNSNVSTGDVTTTTITYTCI